MTMTNIMLALGDYRFGIDQAAYHTLQRSSEYRWQSQARAGRKPTWQYLGEGSDRITLEGEVLPHFRGGLEQVKQMRDQAGQGQPLILSDSDGKVWGKWCIMSIEETWSDLFQNGKPRRIVFRLTLREYGDDTP